MAYDAARGRVVLFGGLNSISSLGDTWEWDGLNWSLVSTSGPSARSGHRMVYDEVNRRVLMFGGDGLSRARELWAWDGVSWWLIDADGPARVDFGMAYDPRRQRVVVFSGAVLGADALITWPGDTWEWDGEAWEEIAVLEAPEGRLRLAMAYDSVRGACIAFGGSHPPHSFFDDDWAWDGAVWTQSFGVTPGAREAHSAASDPTNGRIAVFGGRRGLSNFFLSTVVCDNGEWIELETSGPPANYAGAMAYDIGHRCFVYFGGRNTSGDLNQTWELTLPPNCPADYDGDGFVSGADFDRFVHDFEGGMRWADTNGNGFIEGEDFDLYVGQFEQGCP